LHAQVKIDKIDVKILTALLKDARTSFTDIAQDCGISTNAIVKRFYRLKQSGVIAGTSLMLNPEEMGCKFALAINISVETSGESHVIEMLKKLPNFLSCHRVVGNYDIHAAMFTRSFEEIDRVRDLIKSQQGVKRVGITANLDSPVFFPENLLIQPTETRKSG